jgi:hypothetical protein
MRLRMSFNNLYRSSITFASLADYEQYDSNGVVLSSMKLRHRRFILRGTMPASQVHLTRDYAGIAKAFTNTLEWKMRREAMV